MLLTFQERLSDSPCVERVWRSRSQGAGVFLSVANSHVEITVTRHRGKIFLTVRGPETKATEADCPSEGEWLGIRFKLGTYMPAFAPGELKDRHDVNLPGATGTSFWLNGSAWEYPDFENADTFVARLVKRGLSYVTPRSTRRWEVRPIGFLHDGYSVTSCGRPGSHVPRFAKSNALDMQQIC